MKKMPNVIIDQLKISFALYKNYGKKLSKIVYGKSKRKATGYLLYETSEDRSSAILSCHVFAGSTGTIIITDTPTMLPYAIDYMIAMNDHVILKCIKIGEDDEDRKRGQQSAALTFTFNISNHLCDTLGI